VVTRCPNCGGMQEFRKLTKLEEEYVAAAENTTQPGAYHRCGVHGCLRYQRRSKWQDGGDFPGKAS